MPSKTRRIWIRYTLASLAVVAIPLSHWRNSATLLSVSQPPGVSFSDEQDFGPYTLHVVDRSLWWKAWEYGQICEARIVKSADGPDGYGHYTDYTFHNDQSEPDYFTRCTFGWEAHGVTLTEPTGHKLFIPAQAFTGGR